MPWRWEQTSWRGIQADHPAHWELAWASGADEPGRLTFADRYYHRLDLRWQPLRFVPKLELLLTKYRQGKKGEKVEILDLEPCPSPWQGVLRRSEEGEVVRAVRFFRDHRQLVEATVVWPEPRDDQVEARILASVGPQEAKSGCLLWQAMGISLRLGQEFRLQQHSAKVGRIRWEFTAGRKKALRELFVERIALPEFWLDKPMREWLEKELPSEYEPLRQEMVTIGRHRAERLISSAKAGKLAFLRGVRQYRLDLGWLCPTESRVYHVTYRVTSPDQDIALPDTFELTCCRPLPVVRPEKGDT